MKQNGEIGEDFGLEAVSPIDGRYRSKVLPLVPYFSEKALIRYRLKVEIFYLLFLSQKRIFKRITAKQKQNLLLVLEKFDVSDAKKVKEIEAVTNHDVKAIEYFFRERIAPLNLGIEEYFHFGLTSEDTNNLAYSLSIKEARDKVILPALKELIKKIAFLANLWKKVPMLARTHGQPAVPTTVGKEFLNFAMRLNKELKFLSQLPIEGKLNGAVGNFNAHQAVFPQNDWVKFSEEFIESLGLAPNIYTTQILPADSYLRNFQTLFLINQILIGFNQDMWRYISDNYFLQKLKEEEVGSSTMPQKVNPIDFENSEGNLGMANAIFSFLTEKLAISRLQRDLSDSTVKRNIGIAFAYSLLAYQSCFKGLEKISLNEKLIKEELLNHWEIITEGIQTILRSCGDKNAYEKLKDFARGKKLGQKEIAEFTASLSVNKEIKRRILALTPLGYSGFSEILVNEGLEVINSASKEEGYENKEK
jgi:adenylosuccinate lyase